MSIQVNNLQEYLAARVIKYLKERDEYLKERDDKIKLYEAIFKDAEVCSECSKLIRVRDEEIYSYEEEKYRRCGCAQDDDCRFILCNVCDETYPWHKNNSWFGVHPRSLYSDDFLCPDCGDGLK